MEIDQTTEVRVAPRVRMAKLCDADLEQVELLLAKAEPE